MMSECAVEAKPAVKSKLNWTGVAMVVLGAITDPMFMAQVGDLIPQEWLSRIIFLAGWAVIGLRTLGTGKPVTLNWKSPWGN